MYRYHHHEGYAVYYNADLPNAMDWQMVVHRLTFSNRDMGHTICKRNDWSGKYGPMESTGELATCAACLQMDPVVTNTWTVRACVPMIWKVYEDKDYKQQPHPADSHKSCNEALKSASLQLMDAQGQLIEKRDLIERAHGTITELKTYIRAHGLLVPGEPAQVIEEEYPLNIEVKKSSP